MRLIEDAPQCHAPVYAFEVVKQMAQKEIMQNNRARIAFEQGWHLTMKR